MTIELVEHELKAAEAWAMRRKLQLVWISEHLLVRVELNRPEIGDPFYLEGDFAGYRVVPPAWRFTDSAWTRSASVDYPAATSTPFGGSIFHSKPVICVPFNRLAYSDHGGPHNDWGGPTNWLSAGIGYVRAHTLGDMLSVIHRDFSFSQGRMAP
jgi:hypothetical protein